MNIDYEAIAVQAGQSTNSLPLGVKQTKAIIEAYERQKAAPEWVPLDLEKVKQGWELWQGHWPEGSAHYRFVSTYEGELIVAAKAGICRRAMEGIPWLMRAPKPKTVKVFVFKCGEGYGATTDGRALAGMVGEGDIEVTE